MKTLDSVDEKNIPKILDRIAVLNLCREAMDFGIELRAVPVDGSRCSTILKQVIKKMRPNIECQVRLYATEKMRPYRFSVGKYQLSLCPWYIQLSPIRTKNATITVSRAIRFVIPTSLNQKDSMVRTIQGPIGEYAKTKGFTLAYKSVANGDVLLFAMASEPARNDTVPEQARLMRENVISPVDFCRASALVYDELCSADELVAEAENITKDSQEQLRIIFEKKERKNVEAALAESPKLPAKVEAKGQEEEEDEDGNPVFLAFQKKKADKRALFEETVQDLLKARGG